MAQFKFVSRDGKFKIPKIYATVLNALVKNGKFDALGLSTEGGQFGHPTLRTVVRYLDTNVLLDAEGKRFTCMGLVNLPEKLLANESYKEREIKASFVGEVNDYLAPYQVEEGIWHDVLKPSIITEVLEYDPTLTMNGVNVKGDFPLGQYLVGHSLFYALQDFVGDYFITKLDPDEYNWLEPFVGLTFAINLSKNWYVDSENGWYQMRTILVLIDRGQMVFKPSGETRKLSLGQSAIERVRSYER